MDEIISFPGPHGELFTGYVRYKRALGYAIAVSYQYVLRDIARFIAAYPPAPGIVSLVPRWKNSLPGDRTKACRINANASRFCVSSVCGWPAQGTLRRSPLCVNLR